MKSREGIKNKMILLFFFNSVGPFLLLSAEKRTERSNACGLMFNENNFRIALEVQPVLQ